MSLVVRRTTSEETLPLRRRALRPNLPPSASMYDAGPEAVYVGAWDGEDLVGCATVFPEPYPGPPPVDDAWRLRGMAVDTSRQRGGIGRQVLEHGVTAAREAGAPLMWANARVDALGFYERLGWRAVGDVFLVQATQIPHRVILLDL